MDENMPPLQYWEKMLQYEKNWSELKYIYMFPPVLCTPSESHAQVIYLLTGCKTGLGVIDCEAQLVHMPKQCL